MNTKTDEGLYEKARKLFISKASIDEFAGWEEDARSIKPYALFKLANLSDPNALLAKLATMGQIHSFAEQMPTVSDIFFKAVEGEGGITASAEAL